ncbi:MAG: ATP-binding cassette domain-containing protein [Lentimicrobium sp.]|jgi:ABC-type lipopolysaccharide export system ATPase subunit|nr:ATP-binding cassette domain-containing protein [Lentimicrobium sp.]
MSNLLEIDSVIKSFKERQVLTDIYLKCETGDIVGMLGRNGSGKTTLLKILFGTLAADRKFIRINGKVYISPYKTRNEICYLPQHEFLPKHLIVDKVVELYLGKASNFFLNDEILNPLSKNKVSNLSGGELRYLEIKLLLNTESKFVLLDEPFNGVSPILVQSIKTLIKESSRTRGIILTDHDYRNVLDVANRYCLIFDGGIKPINNKYELVKWGYVSESRI